MTFEELVGTEPGEKMFANQAQSEADRWAMESVFPELLRELLTEDEAAEDDESHYVARNRLVYMALSIAEQLGYKAGFRIDFEYPHWPVAFIELPTGQCSWHLPEFPDEWDGHTTEEKHERIRRFIGSPPRPLDIDTSRV
jgi:hypothetical protein